MRRGGGRVIVLQMARPAPRRPSIDARRTATLASALAAWLSLGACGQDRPADRGPAGESFAAVSQELIAAPELYRGTTLGAKELVLTFDDGPGPLSVTGELSTWLKLRPAPIRATFFVNGACIASTSPAYESCSTPTPSADEVLAQVTSDGHLVGNHTTTHRDLVTEVPNAERVGELAATDALIGPYVPWNRLFFRAPYGSWSSAVQATLAASPMNKYVGPIYWNIGGGPTNATRAADWECWDKGYTTKQCGDLYLKEVRALGKGIVLMHDPYGNTSNHDPTSGTGNTVDMVKYVVPILEGEGFTFKPLSEDPEVAAALPSCDAACADCSGPGANECTSCAAGAYLAMGSCVACSACAAGTYVATPCAATADTVCTPCDASCSTCSGAGAGDCTSCPGGRYLSSGACLACSSCPAGTYESSACAPTSDATCTPCADGTYAPAPGATACASCGSCDDGDACTTDSCDPAAGCSHEAIDGCPAPEDAGAPDAGPPDAGSPEAGAPDPGAPGAPSEPGGDASGLIDDASADGSGVSDGRGTSGCSSSGAGSRAPGFVPALLASLALLLARRGAPGRRIVHPARARTSPR